MPENQLVCVSQRLAFWISKRLFSGSVLRLSVKNKHRQVSVGSLQLSDQESLSLYTTAACYWPSSHCIPAQNLCPCQQS